LEFENVLARRLREQEYELSKQTQSALQEKEATIQTLLSTALEAQKHEYEEDKRAFEEMTTNELRAKIGDEYGKNMEEYKKEMTKELAQKVSALESLSSKLKHLESALTTSQASQEGSLKAHRLSAAALACTYNITLRNGVYELRLARALVSHRFLLFYFILIFPHHEQCRRSSKLIILPLLN